MRIELTEREEAVLELLAEGCSTTETARALFVSPQAVTYHVGNLLAKFQSANRTGMVSLAHVLGILAPTWPPEVAIDLRRVSVESPNCMHGMKGFGHRRTHE